MMLVVLGAVGQIAKEQKRIRKMSTQPKSDFDKIEEQHAEMHRLLDIFEAERYYKGTVRSRIFSFVPL